MNFFNTVRTWLSGDSSSTSPPPSSTGSTLTIPLAPSITSTTSPVVGGSIGGTNILVFPTQSTSPPPEPPPPSVDFSEMPTLHETCRSEWLMPIATFDGAFSDYVRGNLELRGYDILGNGIYGWNAMLGLSVENTTSRWGDPTWTVSYPYNSSVTPVTLRDHLLQAFDEKALVLTSTHASDVGLQLRIYGGAPAKNLVLGAMLAAPRPAGAT